MSDNIINENIINEKIKAIKEKNFASEKEDNLVNNS